MATRQAPGSACAGGRSASGRAGPVVGFTPKRIRPLNPAEIVAHWDILRDTCTAKHGLESAAERLRVDMAFAEALQHALQHGLPAKVPNNTHAFAAVQQALECSSAAQVLAIAPLPASVTRQLLQHCGYTGDQFEAVDLHNVRSFADLPCEFEECVAADSSTETHVIMDTFDELRSMKDRLLGQHQSSAEGVQAMLAQQLASTAPRPEDCTKAAEESHNLDAPGHAQDRFKLHLCDWGRASPAMKAHAAADSTYHVMSSHDLAGVLGVGFERKVLDHVAWSG